MSRRKQDEGITAEDLKRKMYHSLQSAGVLNNLKGYLRQSVINELRGRYSKTGDVANDSDADLLAATMKRSGEGSWNQKAVDNLVLYHLKQSRYLYSLSLFQQESGISEYDETMTEELLLRLGASPDLLKSKSNKENQGFPSPHSSSTPVASADDTKLLMWKILSRISSVQNLAEKIDETSPRQTQQQRPKPMSLADKLQAIDDEMDGTLRERRLNDIEHRKSIATLASATRRAEEAAEKRARESFEQWKKVELASMRVKEQEKAKEQIVEKTHQLENDFAQRKEALLVREKNAIERLNNQKESLEKDFHHERQLLLRELEQIRVREKNLQEREQMQRDTEAVKLREIDLLKSEALGHHQGHTTSFQGHHSTTGERTRRDSVVSSVAESLRKSLTGKESRQLDEVLRELNSRSDEAEVLRRELMILREELNETKAHLKPHSEPRPSPRQREISPRDDESLRKRLDDLTSQLNNWKEQDRAEKEAAIQSEISRWRTEVSKLSDARDRLDEKQKQLDELTARVSTRLNPTVRRSALKHSEYLPATSLRILMDPQNDITRDPSIRDYDPVHTGRVRWADEMPYSVRPDLMSGKRSPRSSYHPIHNLSGNSTLDLDSSNDTASSNDLSTSGLRKDIRQTFKDLEKESEHLEQMYKRYIQSNYKHISPDIQVGTVSPRRTRSSLREKSSPPAHGRSKIPTRQPGTAVERDSKQGSAVNTYSRLATQDQRATPRTDLLPPATEIRKPQTTPRKDVPTPSDIVIHNKSLNESQGPLDLRSLDRRDHNLPPPDGGKVSSHSSRSNSEVSDVPVKESQNDPTKTEITPSGGKRVTEQPDSSPESSMSEKIESAKPPYQLSSHPIPVKRQSALPPIGGARSLPPISPHKGTTAVPSVSELLIGEKRSQSPPRKSSPSKVENSFLQAKEFGRPPQNQEEDSESSFSSDLSFPGKKTSLKSPGSTQEREKSPFERPALLEQKREELQRGLGKSEPVKRGISINSSPDHETKLRLDLQDNGDLQNILDSIDVRSARSIEAETDPKLADLLSQLEPSPTSKTQGTPAEPKQNPIMTSTRDINSSSQSEDSLSLRKDDRKIPIGRESPREQVQKGDTYSDDEFLSSTSSKTASEVKTMSDFEPSSTSIPRIEDKLTGPQQSDEDKSEADVNWSNLQLDKSGEIPRFEQNQDSPRIDETQEKLNVDVFEDSQPEDSFEAPGDGGRKSESSEDDFW